MPDDFHFPSKEMLLWVPASVHPNQMWQKSREDRGRRFGAVFGRLRPGATFEQARSELRVIAAQLERQCRDYACRLLCAGPAGDQGGSDDCAPV
jgi:hypothetical protein